MRVSNVADVGGRGRRCNLLENGGVDGGSLNPRRVLSRWILLEQCQAFVDTVEQKRGNEGDVACAGEKIELDHISRLWGEGGKEPRVGTASTFIFAGPSTPLYSCWHGDPRERRSMPSITAVMNARRRAPQTWSEQ